MCFKNELRDEHELLIGMAEALRRSSRGETPVELPGLVALLGQFTQLLQVHLLREDSVLYPAIEASRDRAAAAIAGALREDHGLLEREVASFERCWSCDEIRRRWGDFAAELAILLASVRRRIEREDEELYPILETPEGVAA